MINEHLFVQIQDTIFSNYIILFHTDIFSDRDFITFCFFFILFRIRFECNVCVYVYFEIH